MAGSDSSIRLQQLLDLLAAGHESARDQLLEHSLERFRRLAAQMFHRRGNFRRIADTDDVVQKALIRLRRALVKVQPPNVRAFFALAAQQVRWVLRDLAREAGIAPGIELGDNSAVHGSGRRDGPVAPTDQPADLLAWAEFHQKIEQLPEEERAMFDLLLYQGLTQAAAADLLGLSLRTVKRRWQHARLVLRDALRGDWPPIN